MESINLRGIDLNLLTIFESLMEYQNATHTAEALGMTQPAVTQAIKRLQSLYNDVLFERDGSRGMKPTNKALGIAPEIRRTLDGIRATLPVHGDFDPKTIDLEYRINVPTLDVSDVLLKFADNIIKIAPNISINFASLSNVDPATTLKNRQYDLVIDVLDLTENGFNNEFLFSDHLVVIARKDHPRLGQCKQISKQQFYQEGHVVLQPRENVHLLHKVTEEIGERKISITVPKMMDMQATVKATDFISVIPYKNAVSANKFNELIIFDMPIPKPPVIPNYISWHWRTEHLLAHRWIRKQLLKACHEHNNDG